MKWIIQRTDRSDVNGDYWHTSQLRTASLNIAFPCRNILKRLSVIGVSWKLRGWILFLEEGAFLPFESANYTSRPKDIIFVATFRHKWTIFNLDTNGRFWILDFGFWTLVAKFSIFWLSCYLVMGWMSVSHFILESSFSWGTGYS